MNCLTWIFKYDFKLLNDYRTVADTVSIFFVKMFISPVSQRRVLVGKTNYSMSTIRIECG